MKLNFKELGEENTQNGTLIIMHGLFGMLDNLMTIGRRFAEKYHVFLLDLRNHGRSGWDEEHTYDAMSLDLNQFIHNQMIKKPVFVLGHSMGGKVAMQFVANYPDVLTKLIIVDIAPKAYPVQHRTIIDTLNSIDLQQISHRNEAAEVLVKAGLDTGTQQFLLKNLYRTEDGKFAWRMNLEVLTAKIANVGEELYYRFPIELPTLFLRGSKSQYIQNEDDTEIKNIFPQAKILTIEGAGHWVHAEKPNEMYVAIMEFLAKA
jgi:pimeloyl-ACP methyl ester carboxylesterase